MKRKDKERKGGVPPLAPAAPSAAPEIGGTVLSGTQSAASSLSSGSSGIASLVGRFTQASGLSALLATKAGMVAMVLAGSTLAAGVSFFLGTHRGAPQRSMMSSPVFTKPDAPDSASAQRAPAEPARTGATSLDYFSQGNRGAALPETQSASAADNVADAAAAPSQQPAAPPIENAPAQQSPAKGPKPKFVAASPFSGGAPGGASASFKPVDSMGGKVGAGFQEVYKPGRASAMRSSARPSYGATRRSAVNAQKGALSQARFANRTSRSAAASSSPTGAATQASRAFEGGSVGPAASGMNLGPANGPAGVAPGPAATQDNKQTEPPAPPVEKGENVTPYQNLIYAGMGALIAGMLLLALAGQLVKSANFMGAKMAAMAAAACGGVAVGIGGLLAGKWGQMLQGVPFIAGGGILAVAAVKVMMDADKAEQDAKTKSDETNQETRQTADEKNAHKGFASDDSPKPAQSGCPGPSCPSGQAESAAQSAQDTANMGAQAAGAAAASSGMGQGNANQAPDSKQPKYQEDARG